MKKLLLVMTLGLLSGCFGESDNADDNGSEHPAQSQITAAFSVQQLGLKVIFTDQSTNEQSSIDSYEWNFGDGKPDSISVEASPEYTYAEANTYQVSLTVKSADGVSSSVTKDITVAVVPGMPVADFTHNSQGLTASFTDISQVDNDTIASYSWNFGDGRIEGTSIVASPVYTYSDAGIYTVTLSVTSTLGLKVDDIEHQITITDIDVAPVNPQANFTFEDDDLNVIFTDSSTVENGSIVSYAWNFGDNKPTAVSSLASPSYTYTSGGTYSVVLEVTGSDGTTASTSNAVTVFDPAIPPSTPVVSFTTVYTGLTVAFTAVASNNTSEIITYAWDFGGFGTSVQANPTFTFPAGGDYNVRLTVTSEEDMSNDVTQIVNVSAPVVELPEYIACQVTMTTTAEGLLTTANRDEELASCFTTDVPILNKKEAAIWCSEQVSTYISEMGFVRTRPTLTANVVETACL